MKKKNRMLVSLALMTGLIFACTLTVNAKSKPTISLSRTSVDVDDSDTSDTVKVKIKNTSSSDWKLSYEAEEDGIVDISEEDRDDDEVTLEFTRTGTGTTSVSVWVTGYPSSVKTVNVVAEKIVKKTVGGYKVRSYGTMKGDDSEKAYILKTEMGTSDDDDDDDELYVYLEVTQFTDDNDNDLSFDIKYYDDDGDCIKTSTKKIDDTDLGNVYTVHSTVPDKTEKIYLVYHGKDMP